MFVDEQRSVLPGRVHVFAVKLNELDGVAPVIQVVELNAYIQNKRPRPGVTRAIGRPGPLEVLGPWVDRAVATLAEFRTPLCSLSNIGGTVPARRLRMNRIGRRIVDAMLAIVVLLVVWQILTPRWPV